MSKRQFRLPSPALVIAMVALALVLGGTALRLWPELAGSRETAP